LSSFHLISDFDGVWTETSAELQAVHETVMGRLQLLSGRSREEVQEDSARFVQDVLSEPHLHGWKLNGRLSSFVDEDVFAMPTSVGQYIDTGGCERTRFYRGRILQKYETVLIFLDDCYHTTCDAFRSTVSHDLVTGSERVLEWLLQHDVQVTFVTNAPAGKVMDWFAHHDFQVADGREVPRGAAPLRVFGRAGKQFLGSSDRSLSFGGREVAVDRPQYRAILEQESPDMVIGDVLSLDLATPVSLRVEGHPAAPKEVGVMHMRHTPQWVLDSIKPTPAGIDHLISHVTSLPRLVLALQHRMQSE
jgi:hypothetical protein